MSIELMKRALEFITGVYFGEHEGSRADREKLEADLTTAIQQAEAQQPAIGEPVAWLDEMLADTREVFDAGGSETPQVVRDVIEYVASWVTVYSEKNRPAPSVPDDVVEDGIRNAEDELNCAEEVLDAITCEFPDGEFPVTDFNCIGDYITAVVDVFKERLAAQQPATGEPVASRNPFASRCYAMSESHLSGHRLIVGFEKLGDAQDAHEWVARQGRGDFTHPAPSVPDDVVMDAERYRWLREQNESLEGFTFYVGCDNGPDDDGSVEWVGADLDAAIDAAMLAAK